MTNGLSKMLSLGKFKPSLVISALKKSVSESRISQKYDGLGVSDFENLDLGVSYLSGARFRRNVNEARFCDASHITRHWTYANPYDLIDATEPFGSALANRFLTLDLFCFCLPTM